MSRFREGPEDEMHEAMRKGRERAVKEQARHDAEGELEDRLYRQTQTGPRAPVSGHWRFIELLNSSGETSGWRVELNGKIAGVLLLRGDDVNVISASSDRDDPNDPTAIEIMAAFVKLYPTRPEPRGRRRHEGSPFGPSRNWDED